MLTATVPAAAVRVGDYVGGRRVQSVVMGRTELALVFNPRTFDHLTLRQDDSVRVDFDPKPRSSPCPSR